ncbi:XK-related protein 8 [Amia ocellicauda]|uniref:XK-related protein 8 n=1 Tax=Amia ocellicauda TaxID=2972642 RepID=UPI0034640EB6
MEEGNPFVFLRRDFFMTLVGVIFFTIDLVLDVWAVVNLYHDGDYICMWVLIFLLVGSSVLVQIFSWLWYSYDPQPTNTKVETFIQHKGLLTGVHVLQLGVFLRYAGVLETAVRQFRKKESQLEGLAVYLTHDLNMLRLFETFSESTPQLILMFYIFMQESELELITGEYSFSSMRLSLLLSSELNCSLPFPVAKIAGSCFAISCSVVAYHHAMRSFLPKKAKLDWLSSAIYFLWNLLLITPRLTALALFASVQPLFIAPHFLVLWVALFICILLQKTDFMDNALGEWLYRGTVAIIWYFSWFNVAEGRTRVKSFLYHFFILLDSAILMSVWLRCRDPMLTQSYSLPLVIVMPILYVAGLLMKVLYYRHFHPKHPQLLSPAPQDKSHPMQEDSSPIQSRSLHSGKITQTTGAAEVRVNKRMRKLAANFYSSPIQAGTTRAGPPSDESQL